MNITCPRCQTAFDVQDAVAAIPVLELADQEQPVLDALPAQEEPGRQSGGAPFAQAIGDSADSDDPQRTLQQDVIRTLVLKSLADCKHGLIDYIAGVMAVGLVCPIVAGAGFLVVLVMYYPLAWGNWLFSGGHGGLLYLLPVGLLLIVSGFRKLGQNDRIEAVQSGGTVTRLKLGRLHDTFAGGASSTLLMAGLLLGGQAGLLYFVPKACDLGLEPTLGQAWILALDTISFSSLSGFLEVFGIDVPARESSFWCDTVFNVFRAAYGAMAALFGYQLYQRWKLRHLLDGLPDPSSEYGELEEWVENLCRKDQGWARVLFDEIMFLWLVGLYLRGQFDQARGLAHRFPWLRIDPAVRCLLFDDDGNELFPAG